jgi:capsule polysaccharide export protein KpsE/RkpR
VAYSEKGLMPALDRLRARSTMIAVACAVAVTVTFIVSLLLTRQYTAISRIVIEPPAGSDPRASTAVSPIYLESLHSYELFASSDNLFLQAVEHFGLRHGSEPIDRLKKSVLKADMPRNTKILEIHATLPDARMAHALALYIAEETVKLNQTVSRAGDQELAGEAEKQAAEIRARVEKAEQEWARAMTEGPVDQLKAELDSDEELRSILQRELVESDVSGAEADPEGQSARARAERYRRQLESLQRNMAAKQRVLGERSARIERLTMERTAAQTAAKSAEARLQEARAELGFRGERLRIIDPGITPERPSSPNIPLNLLIAFFTAAVLSVLYLVMELSYTAERTESARRALRVAGRHD